MISFARFVLPFTRGRERSRSIASIVAETEKAVADGFVEITLLGQNVNSYKHEHEGFSELLEAVAYVKGVKRIRYTSPHPQDINTKLLEVMVAHDNICNSLFCLSNNAGDASAPLTASGKRY
ncbi:MAG: tRNA (N6-isopentenyl adenosine(37)-C2)-methylthiotransferase MiaB, partial [Candidatus Neomarinimicrobiota bacterium]